MKLWRVFNYGKRNKTRFFISNQYNEKISSHPTPHLCQWTWIFYLLPGISVSYRRLWSIIILVRITLECVLTGTIFCWTSFWCMERSSWKKTIAYLESIGDIAEFTNICMSSLFAKDTYLRNNTPSTSYFVFQNYRWDNMMKQWRSYGISF